MEANRRELFDRNAEALALWRDLLGDEGVLAGAACDARYAPNITEYRARELVAALKPRSTEDVEGIVSIAWRLQVPLYPVSAGCNWGLGSKLPPLDGCAIVDLSRMDQILEIDAQLGHAVVQPGVTQEKLAGALTAQQMPWRLNVTGAGGSTSVVANALERGIGMLGQRHRDLVGLEAVLGTGETVRLGLDHLHYPTEPGPDMIGLFGQSNFGIVTSAAIRLQPRLGVCLFFAETDAKCFARFIDDVRCLRQRNILNHRTEIMADNDPRLAARFGHVSDGGRWGTWGAVYGDPPLRRHLSDALRDGLRRCCRAVTFFDQDAPETAPPDVAARLQLAQGIPSNDSIESLRRSVGLSPSGGDLDLDNEIPGMLAVLPAVPLIGKRLQQIVDMVKDESRAEQIYPVMSFSTVSDIAAEGFLRVHFSRRDREAIDRAHRWAERVDRRLRSEGIPLLRLNIGQMEAFSSVDDTARQYLRQIGEVLDPNRIIAPGRYQPGRPATASLKRRVEIANISE
jgi:4-cresol dehydrogenase (hydroxylating)